MTTQKAATAQEQRQRTLNLLRRMVAEKRVYEQEAIESCKTDTELQALVVRLRKENKRIDITNQSPI